jgi:hypothetical protein
VLAVVEEQAGVHSSADLGHRLLRELRSVRCPADDLAVMAYSAICSHIPISGRVVAGYQAAQLFSHRNGSAIKAMVGTPG